MLLFVSAFSALSTLDFLVVFAVGDYVIRFTAISTLATCVAVSISAFNDGPVEVTRIRIVVVLVGRAWAFSGQPDVGSVVVACYALMIVAVIRGSTLICRLHCPRDAAHHFRM